MESVCLGPREPVHERPIDAVTCAPAAAAGNKLTPPSPTCEPLGGKGCFVYCDPHTCVKMCSPEKLAIRAGYSLGHAFHPIFACIMDRTHTSFLTWCVAALQAPLCLFFFLQNLPPQSDGKSQGGGGMGCPFGVTPKSSRRLAWCDQEQN